MGKKWSVDRLRKASRPSLETLEGRVVLNATSAAGLAARGPLREAQVRPPVIGTISGQDMNDNTSRGLGGVRIQLINANGDVVQATRTDARGRYQFRIRENGPDVVREVTPRNFVHTSPTFSNQNPVGP